MQELILAQTDKLTMSSREIADLLGKQHSNIKVSAERLQKSGTIALQGSKFKHNGNEYEEYLLEKRDCLILVAQNSPEFTAAIVDRWQELEDSQKHNALALPDFTDPVASARAWASEYEEKQIAQQQLAIAAPKVAFVDKYVESTGNKTFREVCKILKANERQFRAFLSEKKIMHQVSGSWVPYQNHTDAGRFYVTTGTSNEHAYTTANFTPKGLEWVSRLWREEVAV